MNLVDAFTSLYQAALVQGLVPGKQARPFVIASGPRSGSTLLQTLLHSHPSAVCMHELLIKSAGTSRFYRYNLGRRKELIRLRVQDIKAFLQAILLEPQPPWVKAVGFKAMYVQPRDAEERTATWEALGKITGLHIIWLHRNPVRRVISFAIARKTGEWIGKKTEEPVRLDPEYLPRRLAFEEQRAKAARQHVEECDIIDVQFESLTKDPGVILERIQDFLGVQCRPLHSSLTQQNPRSIQEMVSNFGEIKGALLGTKWEESLLEAVNHQPREI